MVCQSNVAFHKLSSSQKLGLSTVTALIFLCLNLSPILAGPSVPSVAPSPIASDALLNPDAPGIKPDDAALFQTSVIPANHLEGAQSVALADLDRDGRLDAVVATRTADKVMWFRNLGSAQFEQRLLVQASGAYMVASADLNQDGRLDVLVAAVGVVSPSSFGAQEESRAAAPGAVFWLQNNLPGNPNFTRQNIATGLRYPVALSPADIDQDGDMDVLVVTRDDNRVTLYLNDGGAPPSFSPVLVSDSAMGAAGVHAGDIDGDGRLDILSASENDNQIRWYRNLGGTPPRFEARIVRDGPPPPPDEDFAKAVFATDLDGDGDTDIAYAAEEQNQVGWYENRGGGTAFVEHLLLTTANHAKYVTGRMSTRTATATSWQLPPSTARSGSWKTTASNSQPLPCGW